MFVTNALNAPITSTNYKQWIILEIYCFQATFRRLLWI